jgi:phosphoribosyl-AMP cyclohydrolase
VQDAVTNKVLMLGFMNDQALQQTQSWVGCTQSYKQRLEKGKKAVFSFIKEIANRL